MVLSVMQYSQYYGQRNVDGYGAEVLAATQEEIDEVTSYFEWQAPELKIEFMQKVYAETVIGHRHDVWDIHTNRDRWWVITNPTNLYSQQQFPSMDLAVTFHMGLCLRIPRTGRQASNGRRVLPFGDVWNDLRAASAALGQAHNVADYQTIGVRCREVLLAFVAIAQDEHDWASEERPKRADFKAWAEIICNTALPGDSHKERRQLQKGLLTGAWTFTNWLTHAKSATWHDAETAVSTVEHAIGLATSLVIRLMRGVPDQCPECGSPHLRAEEGRRTDDMDILWERPRCNDCEWAGEAVPIDIEPLDDAEGLITREGGASDDEACSIMEVPLRGVRKPGDA
ncbi:hypothetical protein [Devosia sp.]|uniref:hypothetical protein n=1 Tax=Devosia sp. TaxID=1871048 RepID=UPI001B105199|nr:hypothetical protein [Devosia sp.]MBO9589442.1 hypothetical protein [Devosia sp.]